LIQEEIDMPTLIGIAKAPKILAEMQEISKVLVEIDSGIQGDSRGRKNKRQVSILFEDDWKDACNELNVELHWLTRRANLFVSGMRSPTQLGLLIKIKNVELEVCAETEPCALMDKQHLGLRNKLEPNWRGGVCCRVISPDIIMIGDEVVLT
jgi:MOSC domain-containing protein YiiM